MTSSRIQIQGRLARQRSGNSALLRRQPEYRGDYAAITGQYAEYPNLCFVDTLDNVAALTEREKNVEHEGDLFSLGAMSDENVARIKRQNKRKISVIIGNPPYNANQQNENDNNKNRTYRGIDRRIKATYIAESTAQKTKLYDMYARFFRWASDRIKDEGIVAFVTNVAFSTAAPSTDFARSLRAIFKRFGLSIWVATARKSETVGHRHNVFRYSRRGRVSFLVKRQDRERERAYFLFAASGDGDAR